MRISHRRQHARQLFGNFLALLAALFLVAACSGGGGGGSSSSSSTAAPILVAQPQAAQVVDGQPASFSVTAVSSVATTYQWSRDNVAIPGATAATYTIAATQLSDNGATLTVTVTNASGSVQSVIATLSVAAIAPSIANNAATTVAVRDGQPATFTVVASGSGPLMFQWRRGGVAIAGATSASYVLPAAALSDNGATFDVVVTNTAGTVTSALYTLAVTSTAQAPAITVQPQSQVIRDGNPVTFSVTAAGTAPFSYQWLRGGVAIAGAQASTFTLATTLPSDSGAQFSVVVANAAGSVTSAAATLTVTAQPSIALLAGNIGGSGSIDGTGTAARLVRPSGSALDNAGNVFVADGSLIRKVSATGVVTTFAGSTTAGAADGTGSAASFNGAIGVAVDAAGNVYVADSGNQAIRKITAGGVVTTLAGLAGSSGSADGAGSAARFATPSAVAVDASGNVYVADTANQTIRQVSAAGLVSTVAGTAGVAGSTNGIGSAASFSGPAGIAVDGTGTLYVADTGNSTIRKIAGGGVVTTFAGVAGVAGAADGPALAATFNGPTGIALDGAGAVYVGDVLAPSVRRISAAGVVTTLAGTSGVAGANDATGAAASFVSPSGIASDAAGTLYVADRGNFEIRKIDAGGVVTTFAGAASASGSVDGFATAARFAQPVGIVPDTAGNLYVADFRNNVIRKVAPDGTVTTIAGTAGAVGSTDGVGAAARFSSPQGIARDTAGNLYVVDKLNNTVRKITPAGAVSTLAGVPGSTGAADGPGNAATFFLPNAIAVDAAGNAYVTDAGTTIRKIAPDGTVSTIAGTFGRAGANDGTGSAASFNGSYGITVDAASNLYVADFGSAIVRKVTPAGIVTTIAGTAGVFGNADGPAATATFTSITGIAIDGAGNLFVSDIGSHAIRRLDTAGNVSTVVGVGDGLDGVRLGALPGHLSTPYQLAIDAAGTLYTGDVNGILKIVLP